MEYTRTVSIDFDGCLHQHRAPWTRGVDVNDGPSPGALGAVQEYLRAGIKVVVYSARVKEGVDEGFTIEVDGSAEERKAAVVAWLANHGFPPLEVTAEKPHAAIYIDDRAYLFDGENWPTSQFIKNFRPWNKGELPWAKSKRTTAMSRKFARIRELKEELQEMAVDPPDHVGSTLEWSEHIEQVRQLCQLLDEVVL